MKKFNRQTLEFALLGPLVLIGIYSVLSLRQAWGKLPENSWLWLLLIIVGIISGYLITHIVQWIPDPQPEIKRSQIRNNSRIIIYCLLGSLSLSIWIILHLWPDISQWNGTFLPWLVSIGLIIFAGWRIGSIDGIGALKTNLSDGPFTKSKYSSLEWIEICGFILILLLAIFLRTYRIDQIPPGIFVDETNGALDALRILEGNHVSPFTTGWYEVPNLSIYYMAGIIKIFGANFISLKIISLLPAILSVIAIFFLGRLLFGSIAGLCSMLFMAVSRWHLTMSRWGWVELMPPLFIILSLYFLIRGLKSRKAIEFAIGGILCGLMIYTYLSARLAVVIIFLFCLFWIFANPGGIRNNLKSTWKGLALFWFTSFIVVSPLLVTYYKVPYTFINRTNEVSIINDIRFQNSIHPLIDNIIGHLKSFHQSGDNNPRHNLPGEPELDPITGLLFVIGIGYCFFNFRDPRSGLLLIWLILGLAGGVLSAQGESPQSFRTLLIVPAITLFCACVLDPMIRGLYIILNKIPFFYRDLFNKRPKFSFSALLSSVILITILGCTAVSESLVYFGPQANSEAVKIGFNYAENQVANEVIRKLKNGNRVYLSPHYYYFSVLNYLAAGLTIDSQSGYQLDKKPFQIMRPEVDLPIADDGKGATFILDVYYQTLNDYFLSYYPQASSQMVFGFGNTPLYFQIDIAQESIKAIQGLKSKQTLSNGGFEELVSPNIDFDWNQNNSNSVEWTGGLYFQKSGYYEFISTGDLKVVIDNRIVKGKEFFCYGLHDIAISQNNSQQQNDARLSWILPNGKEEIIPPSVFFQTGLDETGLFGQYYDNVDWQGDPICTKSTPLLLLSWIDGEPVPAPFSARYSGYLNISQMGNYHFSINADDGARLMIDNRMVGESLIPNQPNNIEVDLSLEVGYHQIQIDYFQSGGANGIDVFWRTPESTVTVPIPPWVLSQTKR